MNEPHRLRTNLWVNTASAVLSVLVTVALVAIVAAIYGRVHGFTIGDLYDQAFPRYRGASNVEPLPRVFYVASSVCVLIATQIAIACRRFLVRRSTR